MITLDKTHKVSEWTGRLTLFVLGMSFVFGCTTKEVVVSVEVMNPSAIDRTQETVSIGIDQINFLNEGLDPDKILVKPSDGDRCMITQWVDREGDGNPDELLFQVSLAAGEKKQYDVFWKEDATEWRPESEVTTYSRFVPERTDDYTWENDRVAFRTFGPEAQRLIEAGEPGGTLSSGIDLWLKKVSYSIIDSWYAKNAEDPGYYHIEHGEGLDPYHVGASRGVGGSGVWLGDTLVTSGNFINYRTIATGPIRTIFELDYAPWSSYGIAETKRISLDLASQFSKVEVSVKSEDAYPNYTLGITLHDEEGRVHLNDSEGTISYWEPMADGHLGVGVVVDTASLDSMFVHRSKVPDQTQAFARLKPGKNITYFTGFAWTESGQVSQPGEWAKMLNNQAIILHKPLIINVK
ncbi:MAG: DUF4861 family protein [Marinoscillum sp.]